MSLIIRCLFSTLLFCISYSAFAQHYFVVEDDGKKGISQWNGSKKGRVLKPKYDDIKLFDNGIAALKREGKWGFHKLEEKGSEELTAHQYDSVEVLKGQSSDVAAFVVLYAGAS